MPKDTNAGHADAQKERDPTLKWYTNVPVCMQTFAFFGPFWLRPNRSCAQARHSNTWQPGSWNQ